ncbi:hypothetical protein [Halonotius sp. GCM10025705]|uniref:hypothetical protein n=1 Tax=Halonotius sp. GCM10025705 TaxID=3252678 RepID=UPI0036223041
MSDDESVFSTLRKTIIGKSADEQAEALKQTAMEDPASIDEGDINALIELLSEVDPDVVTDALHALSAVASDQPDLVTKATPNIVGDLANRPPTEWSDTPIRDMSDEFMQDLTRGEILLELAKDDPAYLDPVVDDLVKKFEKSDALEPASYLALAHVVADQSGQTGLSRDPFVDWVSSELTHLVSNEDEVFNIQLAETTLFVNLLGELGGDKARETLQQVRNESDDEEVRRVATEAIGDLA